MKQFLLHSIIDSEPVALTTASFINVHAIKWSSHQVCSFYYNSFCNNKLWEKISEHSLLYIEKTKQILNKVIKKISHEKLRPQIVQKNALQGRLNAEM